LARLARRAVEKIGSIPKRTWRFYANFNLTDNYRITPRRFPYLSAGIGGILYGVLRKSESGIFRLFEDGEYLDSKKCVSHDVSEFV
jgi:hypothetical protein